MGDGPSANKVRWGFEGAIKYIVVCSTHLAEKGNNDDFKKEISGYVKDAIIQSLIDHLIGVKVNEILLYFFFLPGRQTMPYILLLFPINEIFTIGDLSLFKNI